MAKLKTVTLGCKVNQYETEYIRQGLVGIGTRMLGTMIPRSLFGEHLYGHQRGGLEEPPGDSPLGS